MLTDWETTPLTVSDLTALNIPSSQLAFLSACHTANSRDLNLLDESINLSSAILLAGYPSVVGTLWRINDSHASEIATDLYLKLLDGTRLETQRSAHGLHEATRLLRDRTRRVPGFSKIFPHDPLVWAPYIHLGI